MKTLVALVLIVALGIVTDTRAQSNSTGVSRQGIFGRRTVGGNLSPRSRTWAFGSGIPGLRNRATSPVPTGAYQGRNLLEAINQYTRQMQGAYRPPEGYRYSPIDGHARMLTPRLDAVPRDSVAPEGLPSPTVSRPPAETSGQRPVPEGPSAVSASARPRGPSRVPMVPSRVAESNRDENAASQPERLDSNLTARLQNALGSPESAVTVSLRGPVALLRGRVANDGQRRLAERFVGLEPGVSQVVNELAVRGSSQ